MTLQQPKVSLCIPTFNRVASLQRSLASALEQTFSNLEIVVSDNNSSDGTRAFLQTQTDSRIKVLMQPENIGMVGNWNACLAAATGEYFLLLSDDDALDARAIDTLLSLIDSSKAPETVAFSYCRARVEDAQRCTLRLSPNAPQSENCVDLLSAFFRSRRAVYPSCTLFRTTDIREIGGYPQEKFVLAVDAYVWMKLLLKRGTAAFTSEPLLTYTVHAANLTHQVAIDTWISDIQQLATLSVDEVECRSGKEVASTLRTAARRYLARLVSGLFVDAARSSGTRLETFFTFMKYRRIFSGPYGSLECVRGVTRLWTPQWIEHYLHRARLLQET